jgi:hypothetical protein
MPYYRHRHKQHPYYIADVVENIPYSKDGVDKELKIRKGTVVFVQKDQGYGKGGKYWNVSNHKKGFTSDFNIALPEDELLNKIKVRRDEDGKAFSNADIQKLYEEHVKPKFEDLGEETQKKAIKTFLRRTEVTVKPTLDSAKVDMPSIEDLLGKFYDKEGVSEGDFLDRSEEYFKRIYNMQSDNPWSFQRNIMLPDYFNSPIQYFLDWLKREVRLTEIAQNKNEEQLKFKKKIKEWAAQGLIPCQRCGGKGSSEAWKRTGYNCYECDGTGYIDPLMLENSGRTRLGLPADYEECEAYLEERKKELNASSSGRLWCSSFNDNYIEEGILN